MERLTILNLTNFFSRELYMYAFGDIRFRKPIPLKKMAYTVGFLICWTLPIFFWRGLPTGIFTAAIMFAPPFLLAHYGSKPIFGGKGLIDFVKTTLKYAFNEPNGWTDFNNSNKLNKEVFDISQEIWISRRREIKLLQNLKEAENG